MAKQVEPYGQAGISGSDIGDEGFRLAAGVSVGPPEGESFPVPPPPPAPAMQGRMWVIGKPPPMRPELARHEQTEQGNGFWWVTFTVAGVLGIGLSVVMAWLNLTGAFR